MGLGLQLIEAWNSRLRVELLATDAHQTCLVARAPGAPAELVTNLDETPLKLMPTSGYTWTEKGAKNVEGTLDKRQ